jgi:glycosyltransferase involved in cell wall biosynthesis
MSLYVGVGNPLNRPRTPCVREETGTIFERGYAQVQAQAAGLYTKPSQPILKKKVKGHMKEIKVAFAYKDFAYWIGYSSVGLNVAAETTSAVLREHGIPAEVWGVQHNVDLFYKIRAAVEGNADLTNVVIMAPWLSPLDLESLLKYFPQIQFVIQAHSNVGGLQGDYRGIGNIRNYLDLEYSYSNLKVAGNSARFVEWASTAFDAKVLYLPNLYPTKDSSHTEKCSDSIDIGVFGATRYEKNLVTAVAAALVIQARLQTQVFLHINVGGDSSAKRVMETIDQMTQGVPGFTVIKHRWMPWDVFKKLVARMDLLLQPSYTESFNLVTADGVVSGVPSVVSTAVTWAPTIWRADSDDAVEIASRGIELLEHIHEARERGIEALEKHNHVGLGYWKEYLYGKETWLELLKGWFHGRSN